MSIRYRARPESALNVRLRGQLRHWAQRHRRYGTPRMTALARRQEPLNHKRVERLWKEEGLPLPKKRRWRRPETPVWARVAEATRPNEVWCLDFVHDRTYYGQNLKMLTVLDEYTRECLEIRVEKGMGHLDVLETLDELMAEKGAPGYLRSDNGAEFIALPLQKWLHGEGVRTVHTEPGSPWQNGFIESFNGKLRDECLNQEIFFSRAEAQVIVDAWRVEYNSERPHSGLGFKTPLEVLAAAVPQQSSASNLNLEQKTG